MAWTAVGFDGTVGEFEFAQIMDLVGQPGVVGTYNGTAMSCTRNVGARTVTVKAGSTYAAGVLATLDVDTVSPASAANSTGSNRIDLLVVRYSWSGVGGTASLVMLQGGSQPPALTQNPGVTFDIPICQILVRPAVGEFASSDLTSRRDWVMPGLMVQSSATPLPAATAGRAVYHPDNGYLLVGKGTTWSTFRPWSDTGWQAIVSAYPGFTGSTWGRILNGIATVTFPWTKGPNSVSSADIQITLPQAYRPNFDVTGTLVVGSPKAPVLLSISNGDGITTLHDVTINAGQVLWGSITYPVG